MAGTLREAARFLAAVEGRHSDAAIRMTAWDLADTLVPNDSKARALLERILRAGAEAVKNE